MSKYKDTYITQTGTQFLDPSIPSENLGEVLQIIFDQYPEIKDEMKSLFVKEGISAYGESGAQGVGLFGRLTDYFRDIDEDLLDNAVNNAIEGLSSLEYVSAYPYKESRSMAYGEYLLGQDPMSNEENYSVRNFENIPDTVFYPSPSSIEFGVYDPDFQRFNRKTEEIDKETILHALVHEGLLHGMNLWHPSSHFVSGSSRKNYMEATDNIINYLSNEDKELIMELMIPEGRDKPAELYYP